MKTRIAIVGWGNLGKGVAANLKSFPDMELAVIFTRRPSAVKTDLASVVSVDDMKDYAGKVDVAVLCGGSATDLPTQGPRTVEYFDTVDSFDTHADIPKYFAAMDEAGKRTGHLGCISVGWDPGLFSITRAYSEAVLPHGDTYTFWGKGVSQGHSDAIRRVKGVKRGVQYTVPIESALESVRCGNAPKLTTREKHKRECFVVAESGADKAAVTRDITTMKNYFADYDTTVHFINEEEFERDHGKMPHGGFVLRSGKTGNGDGNVIEYSLKLESNPLFTSSVLLCYARATALMKKQGRVGAMTVLDVPPAYLSALSHGELIKTLL